MEMPGTNIVNFDLWMAIEIHWELLSESQAPGLTVARQLFEGKRQLFAGLN